MKINLVAVSSKSLKAREAFKSYYESGSKANGAGIWTSGRKSGLEMTKPAIL